MVIAFVILVILAVVVAILISAGSVIFFWWGVHKLAKKIWFFTEVPEGHFVGTNKSGDMANIIGNNNGFCITRSGFVRELTDEERHERIINDELVQPLTDHTTNKGVGIFRELMWRWFGLYYMGIPGFYELHTMQIQKSRPRQSEKSGAATYADKWIDYGEKTTITALRRKFTLPMSSTGIELPGDGSIMNFVGEIVCEVVHPYTPMYVMTDFQKIIVSAVHQELHHYLSTFGGTQKKKQLTYKKILAMPKSSGSELSEAILAVNERTRTNGRGILEQTGIRIIDFYITHYDGDEKKMKDLIEAQQKAETEIALAKGLRAKAQGQADALAIRATQEAARYQQMIAGLKKEGVSADVAAEVIGQIEKADRMKDAGLGTYVEGGSSRPGININT